METHELERWASSSRPTEGPPSFPEDIEALDSSALCELYHQVDAWFAYVASLLRSVQCELLGVHAARAIRRAQIARQAREDLLTKPEIAEAITLDPEHRRLSELALKREQDRITLDSVRQRLRLQIRMLSSHVELRRQDVDIARLDGKTFRRRALKSATKKRPRRGKQKAGAATLPTSANTEENNE